MAEGIANGRPAAASAFLGEGVCYELLESEVRETTAHSVRAFLYADIAEVNLRYLGSERHLCTLVSRTGQRMRVAGSLLPHSGYANFLRRLHSKLQPFSSAIRYSAGHAGWFVVGTSGVLVSGAALVFLFVTLFAKTFMMHSGWTLGAGAIFGSLGFEAAWDLAVANRPRKYHPGEGRYPAFVTPRLP